MIEKNELEQYISGKRHEASSRFHVALDPELKLVENSVHQIIEKGLKDVRDLDTWGWNEIRFLVAKSSERQVS